MKFVLGITGGSGSGKSTLSAVLKKKNAFIIDADVVAREVVEKGEPALYEIEKAFGKDVLFHDGTLDRKKVGQIVFSDREKLDILNSITHKYIIQKIKTLVENTDGFLVIDAALLFETGLDKLCDKTIAVVADDKCRIERIVARDGISDESAKDRISSQMEQTYYKTKADFVLSNNGSFEEFEKKADAILNEIM